MENKGISQFDHKIFAIFTLFWVTLGWLGFILSLIGYFRTWVIVIYLIASVFLLLKYNYHKKIFSRFSSELAAVAVSSAIIIIILSFFTTPTVFSGRDQGSFSEAAIRLAQNHQLEFSTPSSQEFFKIYGPGKALNFPGFYYKNNGSLITQFPLPYISWLAIFYSLFGLAGLVAANAILFFIFAISFYLLARLFMDRIAASGLLILALTSIIFFWFSKFTLSENLALALIWFGILTLVLFLKEKNDLFFASALTSAGLMIFARVEGMAIFFILIIILAAHKDSRNYFEKQKFIKIFLPLLLIGLMFIIDFAVNFNYFREIGKAILNFTSSDGNGLNKTLISPAYYILKVFIIYGIIQYLVLGLAGIIYLLKKRKYLELVPFFTVAPVFIYLLDSHISSDHPWMLRRYVFAVFPALLFYTVLFLNYWLKKAKILLFTLIAILGLLNLQLFLRYAFFSENKKLLSETQEISKNFSARDLVLVDRLASRDGWSMITGPMNFIYGKQAVYFFNPDDLDKIDTKRFNKIYLVTPAENISFFENSMLGNRMKFYKDYSIDATRLDIEKGSGQISLPAKINTEVKGKIFEISK